MKQVILAVVILLVSTHSLFSMHQPQEKIPNEIRRKLLEIKEKIVCRETTHAERREYNYNGIIVPIYIATRCDLLNSKSIILTNAQPSALAGFWFNDTFIFSHHLFLETSKQQYHARINRQGGTLNNPFTIQSSCYLADEDKLAILWEDQPYQSASKLYVTMACAAALQRPDAYIDLDLNKSE